MPAPPSNKPPRKLSASDIAQIRKRYDCDRQPPDEDEAFRLDAANSLAIVPCMMHAYQSSGVVVVLPDAGAWKPAPLERRFGTKHPDQSPEWMTEPDFNPAGRSLSSHYKGRGLGDCGGSETYVWDGRQFRLAFLNAMDRCGGSHARITLWRTSNHPGP
jgi:hypothetical protein